MKIAIASTGLGTIARGIETWALDTACALHRRGLDVTLFASAHTQASDTPVTIIPCLKRGSFINRLIVRTMPGFTWRWGFKSDYALEQKTFWRKLGPILNRNTIDILHVQDPLLADGCRRARLKGRTTAHVILAHGTEEPLSFLAPFENLQHLAPWHLEQARQQLDVNDTKPHWTAIPNFVNTKRFRPTESDEERASARRSIGIPEDAFVIGTAAAIKRTHKRIDWLIEEFSHACNAYPNQRLHLVIAGAKTEDFNALQTLAHQCAGDRISFLPNYPHAQMPALYRSLDAFVLASVFEMMPIALLEAIATGLPVMTHQHPVLAWMSGPGGIQLDMRENGALTTGLGILLQPSHTTELGLAARTHATSTFSEDAVINHYINYYQSILEPDSEIPTPHSTL
jgi:1,2-diacylglycerol 3-alpha-glucosyltransferase